MKQNRLERVLYENCNTMYGLLKEISLNVRDKTYKNVTKKLLARLECEARSE